MLKGLKRIIRFLVILICICVTSPKKPKLSKFEIEIIKKGVFLDSYMLSQNELFYRNTTKEKDKLKEEITARKLTEDEITLTNLGFFCYDLGYANRVIWS